MPEFVTFLGIPGLKAALAAKSEELRAASIAAVAEEVVTIAADARAHAPVDTGRLRKGIEPKALGLTGEIHSTVNYGVDQEFGTKKNPAHPFMQPAYEAARLRFPRTAATFISRALGV